MVYYDLLQIDLVMNQRDQLQIDINAIKGKQRPGCGRFAAVNDQAVHIDAQSGEMNVEAPDLYTAAGALVGFFLDFSDHVSVKALTLNEEIARDRNQHNECP